MFPIIPLRCLKVWHGYVRTHLFYYILFPVVQHRMADAAPRRDIHGEMDEVALGQVEEMAVELDAQASADAAREVENAF